MCAGLEDVTSVPVVTPGGISERSELASSAEPLASELLVSVTPVIRTEDGLVSTSGSVVLFRLDVSRNDVVKAKEGLSCVNADMEAEVMTVDDVSKGSEIILSTEGGLVLGTFSGPLLLTAMTSE